MFRCQGSSALPSRGKQSIETLEQPLVMAGISLDAALVKHHAHTDARVQGLVSLEGFIDSHSLAGAGNLPPSLLHAIHGRTDDTFFSEDLPAVQAVAASHQAAGLYLYEDSGHLFTDSSWDTYDAAKT